MAERPRKPTDEEIIENVHVARSSPTRMDFTSSNCSEAFMIGVVGGTASGKTSVCEAIHQSLSDRRVAVISQDSFYRALTQEQKETAGRGEYNFDHPDAFDYPLLEECLLKMRNKQQVDIPIYDFTTHSRVVGKSRTIPVCDVIIVEGILLFYTEEVRNMCNMKIFVSTDADTRLARRIKRDVAERGRDVEGVIHMYEKFVKPSFQDFCLPTKKFCDIIIPRGADNYVAIDLIVQHVERKLADPSISKLYSNLVLSSGRFQMRALHTKIRNKSTNGTDFAFYADRIIRLTIEEALGLLPFKEHRVETPAGGEYYGVDFASKICAVSIIRGGEAMENGLRAVCRDIRIGKILMERLEGDAAKVRYCKLPPDITQRWVLLLEPVLAVGVRCEAAVNLLIEHGVPESRIIFMNLIASPQGVHNICRKFPAMKFVTSEIDEGLRDDKLVLPGIGDFGDRYFGTDMKEQ